MFGLPVSPGVVRTAERGDVSPVLAPDVMVDDGRENERAANEAGDWADGDGVRTLAPRFRSAVMPGVTDGPVRVRGVLVIGVRVVFAGVGVAVTLDVRGIDQCMSFPLDERAADGVETGLGPRLVDTEGCRLVAAAGGDHARTDADRLSGWLTIGVRVGAGDVTVGEDRTAGAERCTVDGVERCVIVGVDRWVIVGSERVTLVGGAANVGVGR